MKPGSAFDRALALVLEAEGGYSNDPRDPGGETNFGISKRAYPRLDIKALTIDQAREIYLRDYWLKAKCERLPDPVAIALFDSAVNQGVDAATKLLQRAVGVPEDGVLGNLTIAAVNALGADDLFCKLMAERALAYWKLPNMRVYGRGWMRRLFHVARSA